MKARAAYPRDTARNGCFLLGTGKLKPGARVVDTGRDLEDFPAHGRIVISENAIMALNSALGWVADPKYQTKLADVEAENAQLRAQLDEARQMLADVVRARELVETLEALTS